MKAKRYKQTAIKYADEVISGQIVAGKEVIAACQRFKKDLQREDLTLHTKEPDIVLNIIENTLVHSQGEDMKGNPLLGRPFILEPWQIFIIYNLIGFYYKGTTERRYKEAFIEIARKNGKTSLIAALAWAMAILQRKSGSTCYIVANAMKQTLQAFNFILFSLQYSGIVDQFKVINNSFDHSIEYVFRKDDGTPDGSLKIIALAASPDKQDSFNCNFAICDEVASYRLPAQYNRFKEAMKAYRNKLIVGITTAGDNVNSFGYGRQEYAVKVATGLVDDDSFFSFVARADQNDKGEVDYTNPIQHMKANPNYGVTVTAEDLKKDSLQALNDPQQRKDFLSRSLNIYSAAMKAWFDIDEFRASDAKYTWTLEELAELPIDWYGGADLSRMYDLTAAALAGQYQGVDIVITHAFFPVTQAANKADRDSIPFYEWLDEGWLTLCNNPTINANDIVNWFVSMRDMGFKIKQVGHDRKFAGEEYFPLMKKAHFSIVDQPQLYYLKSQGFRHIEKSAKDGNLYYLHSPAYEYCIANVKAEERVDDAVQYEKISPEMRIDLFDASVFATIRMLKNQERKKKAQSWFEET